MDTLRIPPRYEAATFESFVANGSKQERVLALARRYTETFLVRLDAGESMIFSGSPGTGKTHLGYALCREVSKAGFSVVLTTAPKVIRNIRGGRRYDADVKEQDFIDFYAGVDLLAIDEIGVGLSGDSDRSILFDLINERYSHRKPMILITNLSPLEIGPVLGESTLDRVMHGGMCLAFDWPSHRKAS